MIRDEIAEALDAVGPMTAVELEYYLKQRRNSINKALRRMLEGRHAYICEWRMPTGRGSRAPVYAAGNKLSVPEPPAQTSKEVNLRYRQRNKAELSIKRYGTRSRFANIWNGLLAN